ncbi:MAG: four helix bundle protein [Nitrospinae bacterium]|nr:four helix bundle protein [Nitrospinota bacterium]MBI5747820.1 four helix bundle protein [Nitrospinota bacterium]
MDDKELKQRTKDFVHKCVKLTFELPKTNLGRHIASQLIRCSTSVAENYRAVCLAQSKDSFIAKVSIVLEEIDESAFWLEFIIDENMPKKEMISPLLDEANELTSIFYASRKTARLKK